MNGLIGSKLGMSSFFTKEGIAIPITIIKITDNRIVQIKNKNNDGYFAIQVTTGNKNNKKLKKSEIGHFKKNNVKAGYGLWEFRLKNEKILDKILTIKIFKNIKKVDITAFSKGKGFSGTVKRWGFHIQDASHGNSLSHRVPGSIGQNQSPGKVFKGKKMSGHMGNKRTTIQNLDIIEYNIENDLLLVKGAVPGKIGSNLIIKEAIKNSK